ncbi:MAG: heavy-metal-associated domain-containing protein [Mycobacteriales bacterium]
MSPPTSALILVAPDVSCERCRAQIEADLAGEPGVRTVTVALSTCEIRVDYDPTVTSPRVLRAALTEAGYPPEE